MPHFPKPFFKKGRRLWYVEIDRTQVNLGPDRDEAFRRYYQLMTQPRATQVATDCVLRVIDAFLEWCSKNRSGAPTAGIATGFRSLRKRSTLR